MKHRMLLSGLLACGMNMSLCTGGVLSSFAVFAAELESPAVAEEVLQSMPMSFAMLEYMSCSVSEDDEEGTDDISSPEFVTGCKDKKACLTQSHQSTTDKTIFLSQVDVRAPFPLEEPEVLIAYEAASSATARAGPLFEESITYAHSLQKRE